MIYLVVKLLTKMKTHPSIKGVAYLAVRNLVKEMDFLEVMEKKMKTGNGIVLSQAPHLDLVGVPRGSCQQGQFLSLEEEEEVYLEVMRKKRENWKRVLRVHHPKRYLCDVQYMKIHVHVHM